MLWKVNLIFVLKKEKSKYTDILRILLLNKLMFVFPSCYKYCMIDIYWELFFYMDFSSSSDFT